MKKKYVIACSKLWNKNLIQDLESKTGHDFLLIREKHELNIESLNKLNPQMIFFPHWSFIIPEEVFSNFTCIIFHMTDLPYGRGGSPLQNLIIREHKTTKISALKCVRELDAGPVYFKRDLDLSGRAQDIYERANNIVEEMILKMVSEEIEPHEQTGEAVSFKRRTPDQSDLSEIDQIEKIYDYIRMLDADGYPRAFLKTNNIAYEFSEASLVGDEIIAKVRICKK